MTTEDDFQRALDLNWQDWQTRLVLADFLQDLNDRRAAGYRALGVLRAFPDCWRANEPCWRSQVNFSPRPVGTPTPILPKDWYSALPVGATYEKAWNWNSWGKCSWVGLSGRKEIEDVAAEAFLKLPAERQAELLGVVHAR